MRDWRPREGVHEGRATYCSPACGGKCRKSDYDYCVERSQALAHLMGDGWTPRVWENLGWHYCVSKGCATVHANYRHTLKERYILSGYTCFFNSCKQEVVSNPDPRIAFQHALSNHKENIRAMRDHLEIFE